MVWLTWWLSVSAVLLSCSEGLSKLGYYNGSVSHTDAGSPCLRWTNFPDYMQQYPNRGLGDHNFCRSPDRETKPWCFFRKTSGAIGWAYCDCHQGELRVGSRCLKMACSLKHLKWSESDQIALYMDAGADALIPNISVIILFHQFICGQS